MSTQVPLAAIASARSGDKGADANIGLWAADDRRYAVIREQVTAERVAAHFSTLVHGQVERFELPNLRALNFILGEALDGGGAASLRTDAQGKTLSLGLLQMVIEVPDELAP